MHPKIKKSIFLIGFAFAMALAARYFLNDLVQQLDSGVEPVGEERLPEVEP